MNNSYREAKEIYASIGVDTDKAIEQLEALTISMHCWQGDDVKGFEGEGPLTGGIQVTGNYPGRARNACELRADIDKAFSLIAGKHKANIHAIYLENDGKKVDRNEIEPKHFKNWVDWAKERDIGLDFNGTFFSHPLSDDGFTLSSADENIRSFWIEHGIRSRQISEYFGKETGKTSVNNIWIPDGYKDTPVDRYAPRARLKASLDKMLEKKIDKKFSVDAVESKVFGIGSESYVVGSNEFYMGYATQNNIALTLDLGHFHPSENVADKISAAMLYVDNVLFHVSRPVRWDSDHIVIMDDALMAIANDLVRGDYLDRTFVALDYFDGSVNRIAAWVIGMRNTQKAFLKAFLEPVDMLKKTELDGDLTSRLALAEEFKSYPFAAVWDYFCEKNNVPVRDKWIGDVKAYEKSVLANR